MLSLCQKPQISWSFVSIICKQIEFYKFQLYRRGNPWGFFVQYFCNPIRTSCTFYHEVIIRHDLSSIRNKGKLVSKDWTNLLNIHHHIMSQHMREDTARPEQKNTPVTVKADKCSPKEQSLSNQRWRWKLWKKTFRAAANEVWHQHVTLYSTLGNR